MRSYVRFELPHLPDCPLSPTILHPNHRKPATRHQRTESLEIHTRRDASFPSDGFFLPKLELWLRSRVYFKMQSLITLCSTVSTVGRLVCTRYSF